MINTHLKLPISLHVDDASKLRKGETPLFVGLPGHLSPVEYRGEVRSRLGAEAPPPSHVGAPVSHSAVWEVDGEDWGESEDGAASFGMLSAYSDKVFDAFDRDRSGDPSLVSPCVTCIT
jgi:hypothetical protein